VLDKAVAAGLLTVDENADTTKLEDAAGKKKRKNLETRLGDQKVDLAGYHLTPSQLKFYFS